MTWKKLHLGALLEQLTAVGNTYDLKQINLFRKWAINNEMLAALLRHHDDLQDHGQDGESHVSIGGHRSFGCHNRENDWKIHL